MRNTNLGKGNSMCKGPENQELETHSQRKDSLETKGMRCNSGRLGLRSTTSVLSSVTLGKKLNGPVPHL